ncbi:hypothetical protein LITTLEE_130 [Mycobacterium phage LittleE]|uniref:Uncharacterized protein n=2 Tax=Omegavirus TaxID=1623292 RepID=Q854D0_BPMOM|nr:gp137 [Mycobacterium phage Omega]YP_009637041.1 hypothetical protein FGG27_gp130 [Mycobacterium phage LittleE]ASD50884.1 hypothetical protein PORCELAIN_125 [Mycobacterium phage Porcelain]ASD53515.1 hypothetical protein PBI_LUCKY2013_122 [Mycobacterium phage Lucky2013]ASZ74200.1 hypothetical protein SEA_SQUINT_124 [Mycobacterium phage Squint]QGJ93759.1 hypothetical protein SEA_HANNACONDA_118 [Mycobacterium phage Hannaconda]AAN12778.1 hypothetical protein PBI_OMEGA_137 [Mycobacterium phage O
MEFLRMWLMLVIIFFLSVIAAKLDQIIELLSR